MTLLQSLGIELKKLHGSMAALLMVVAPALIAVFMFFGVINSETPSTWGYWMGSATGMWAVFMLPMSVTALTILTAQIEHGPRAWDQLRALPFARSKIYISKALGIVTVVAVMSCAVLLFGLIAVLVGGQSNPDAKPVGEFLLLSYLATMGRVILAATLQIAIQFWLAIRFVSVLPGLAAGIGGTFFAVVATGSKQGVFLPWQMPVYMLTPGAAQSQIALGLGLGAGLAAMALAIIHLTRRDVP